MLHIFLNYYLLKNDLSSKGNGQMSTHKSEIKIIKYIFAHIDCEIVVNVDSKNRQVNLYKSGVK